MAESSSWILLTNDDGPDSPALLPMLRELSGVARVECVVPATECSWTSKIVTRFSPLELQDRQVDEFTIHTLTGYPADCANLGINNLLATKPSLVVSGVNVGTNSGLAYFLSSGTVGAAVEAMLTGVLSVAFSMHLEAEDYASWRNSGDLSAMRPAWDNAARVAGEVVQELLNGGLPDGASMLTVNMPSSTTPETPRRMTGLTRTGYGAVFACDEATGLYRHSFSGLRTIGENGAMIGDIGTLEAGEVAITPIRFDLDVTPSDDDRRRFERV